MKQPLLIVFAKNPALGKVKTRLAKTIGTHNALKIYQQLLQKTAHVLAEIEDTIYIYGTEKEHPIEAFNAVASGQFVQHGNNLGQRMARAFDENFPEFSPILIIGADLWTLEKEDISNALQALKTHDIVIGPSEDGGYYLLGLNHPHPNIFINKQWGSSTVFNDTCHEIKDEKLYLLQLKNDIDTYADLIQYPELLQCIE